MAGNDVDIYIRGHNGQAIRVIRDTEGRLHDMRGRFVSESALMSGAMNKVGKSIGSLIPIATAAIPVTAALGAATLKTAGAAGGAVTALAAFGAAAAGQISSLSEAAEAQKKYEDAVAKSGRGSKQAAEAQRAASAALASMPEATQRAAVGFQTLKGTFQEWSDGLAGFTMAPAEKSFALMGRLLPELTPMVEGTSTQLGRLMDVAGGAMSTPGFDALSKKFSTFANDSLKSAVDGIIHFARTLSDGETSGPLQAFMDYAERNGPAVKETLSSLGDAVSTLVEAAADAGPGMLTLVNAAAQLVAALPPELVTVLLQTAVALKAVSLAGAAAGAVAGGVAALGARITALGAASAAAGGGLVGMNAALNTMGAGGKAMLAAGAVGALALVMHQLSDNKGPVAVDELTTSLNTLATTGQVTGALKGNFDEMSASIAIMSKGASDNKFLQLTSDMGTWLGIATGPSISDARKNVEAWDEVMANNVKAGNPKLAAAQFEILRKAWLAADGDLGELKESTAGYSDAQADAKFELEYAAQSMGVFGQAAQDTSAKLEAQRGAADGLRASILALNDVNRSAHDAQTQFEGALDGLTESFAKHGATLSADTEAGRANRDAMSQASAAQDELLASGIAAGDSLASMTSKSESLRTEMMRLATEAFGGSKQAATDYVNTLLGVPSEIKTMITAEKEQAVAGVREVQAALAATPGAKSIKVDALNGAAIAALEAVGLKVRQLPDGRTEVYAANGNALDRIDAVGRALAALNGRTATTYVQTVKLGGASMYSNKQVPKAATGGLYTGAAFRYADGGPVRGPGTGTSDDVPAPWLSNGEFVMKTAAVQKYGERFMQSVNDGEFKGAGYAKGGKVTDAQRAAAKARADAERSARADLRGQFGVNRFGRMAGWSQTPFQKGLGAPQDLGSLVSALSKARGDIGAATSGRTESSLLRTLDSVGRRLIGQEKALGRVNGALEKARDKLDSLKSAAASLSSSVRSGILTSANITRGNNSGGPVTVAGIMGGLTESRDKGSAFAQALKDLKKAGLDKGLIEEIGQAGTDGGGLETAGALLGASGSEIASLNELRAEIVKSAGAAGATTADAMYGAAIKAQTTSVNKLQQSQDRLEKSMAELARAMEKTLAKAIGKKAAGGIVGGSGRTLVGEHGPELLDLAVGSRVWSNADSRRLMGEAAAPWASMLNTPRRSSGVRGAAGGAQEVRVVLEIQGTGNSRYQDFLVNELQQAVRARGSIEATLKPPRGR